VDTVTILVAVAVDDDKRVILIDRKIDVGFFSDRHRVRKRRQRSEHSDNEE
jgi:hypothetical protein